MKKLITICLLLPFLISCSPAEETLSKTIFINSTTDTVFVRAMMDGDMDTTYSFELAPMDSLITPISRIDGLVKGDCYNMSFVLMDSVVVSFGDKYVIAHQGHRYTGDTTRVIPYSSPRNLYNIDSYYRKVTENSKNSRLVVYDYTFTEEDINP